MVSSGKERTKAESLASKKRQVALTPIGPVTSSSGGRLAAVSTAASIFGVYHGILLRRQSGGGATGAFLLVLE
jgi:hypothetical protein